MVRILGAGFADAIEVSIGAKLQTVLGVVPGTDDYADVLMAELDPGTYDLTVRNLDANGGHVAGEVITVKDAFTVERPSIAVESDLTRIMRRLLQELKRQVLENIGPSVSVDYDDTTSDGSMSVMFARLPAIVISAPDLVENRAYSTNSLTYEVGQDGVIRTKAPSQTFDLVFNVTAGSTKTAELLNIQQALSKFWNRNKYLVVDRDGANPGSGTVEFEMDPMGGFRNATRGSGAVEDVRVAVMQAVIRGVDVDEGQQVGVTAPVDALEMSEVVL